MVAFAHEYDEPKDGPFTSCIPTTSVAIEGFADCRAGSFKREFLKGDVFHVKRLRWSGIPTQAQFPSFYALCLPEFAIRRQLSILPQHTAATTKPSNSEAG